ncbi:MAG: MFS transporter, partial [Burkholderiaceae bacterium]
MASANQAAAASFSKYSGLMASAHFLAQSLTCVAWGRLSDRYGRKPFLLQGTVVLGMAILMLGLSVRLWQAVLSRFLGGLFNSNFPLSKAYLADVSTPENRT